MDNYDKCIIAFLDILGFKKIIKEKGFNDVIEIFNSIMSKDEFKIAFQRAVNDVKDSSDPYNRYNESLEKVDIYIMSDSIVVFTPDEYPESLAVVVDMCDAIQQKFLNLQNPVLLRGALAVGDIYCKDSIIFGKGLVDAYLAQEIYAVYPRIIVSREIADNRKVSIDSDENLPLDKDQYYRIDSIERFLNISNADSWKEIEESDKYKKLQILISDSLKDYDADSVRQKYIWLDGILYNIKGNMLANEGIVLMPKSLS